MTLTPWQFGLGLIFAIFALMAGIYVALEQIAAWRERRARRITAAQLARCTSPAFRGRGWRE